MEDLLVCGISWGANFASVHDGAHILDMVQDNIGRLAVDLVILPASNRCYMRCDSSIDDHIFLTGMLSKGQTPEDLEATAMMNIE